MMVLRWGRSAYETDADLLGERARAEALGLQWLNIPTSKPPAELRTADVLVVTSGVKVNAAVVADLHARLVLTTTSGFDHIDVPACHAAGIVVGRCPMARRDAVAEQAVSELIAQMRGLPWLDGAARRNHWARAELPELAPRPIAGSRIAVIGYGVIGRHVTQILRTMGATVLSVDPLYGPPDVVPLDAIGEVDAVTLHCSLGEHSRGQWSRARLQALPRGATFVNTARGDVLDVQAAVDLVRAGHLRGLSCDVFPEEPYPQMSVDLPQVRFTPHSSGFVRDLGQRVAREVGDALAMWVRERTVPHVV